jgi:ribosomal-protein-alanine N-acetyltransferase
MAWALEQSRLNYQLAVCHKSRLTPLVGCAGLRRAGYPEVGAELGIELGPDVWGRYRYAVEITQAVLELGFRHLRLERIVGVTLSANEPVRSLSRRAQAGQRMRAVIPSFDLR